MFSGPQSRLGSGVLCSVPICVQALFLS